MNDKSNESLFCWEQVRKTNRLFRMTRVFAADSAIPGLLPLYAFFSSVEQICSEVEEEDVARSKLDWWRRECLYQDMESSSHPVVRELCRTGASSKINRQHITQILDGAEFRLDAPAPSDMEALERICQDIGQPQLKMELGISGTVETSMVDLPSITARMGLIQLIRESAGKAGQGKYWWIPLSLHARHGTTRAQVSETTPSGPAHRVFAEILQAGRKWGGEFNDLQDNPDGTGSILPLRHLLVTDRLYKRKMKRLESRGPAHSVGELNRLRLADLVEAWTTARLVSRL